MDPNSNSLRNGNITVETVPFKEECRIIDSDKAELIVFDVSSEIKTASRFLSGMFLCTLMETMKEMYSSINRIKL
jgi:hypothetical protein